ncbi:proclotting enzyme-like [Chelonus insularis]|uniref:proclotting enzyme-like n=1 Tax=Chelonus insularis TaxID=460826 RepID=UPI00158B30C8|nr:proclotting enzyme-like [Chelonus insularis]
MRKHTRERVAVMMLFHLLTVSLFESGQASSEHVDPVTIDMTRDNGIIEEKVKLNKDNLSSNLTDNLLRKPRGPRGCGMASKSRTRVVGGQPADPKEWPWMVALIRRGSRQYCGGVLITDRHVLTAAHCLYRISERDIIVRLGEYDFSQKTEHRALDFKVVNMRIHEKFNPSSYDNDIAILKIHRPTVFNNYIWPICLPPEDKLFEHKNAIVTGWGSQYYAGPSSSILMEVSIPVWSHNRCVQSLGRDLPDTVLCAGAYEGGQDSCQGDSGGPLVYQLGNGRWVNIGIVSWGMRCGEPGQPGIYTRVNAFLDWIFANAVF